MALGHELTLEKGDGAGLYQCKVTCLHDNILVRMVDQDNLKTPSGIYVPETADREPVAQIVEVGPGMELNQLGLIEGKLKRGDLVLLSRYTGRKVLLNNIIHQIIKFGDISCKLSFFDNDGKEIPNDIPEESFITDPDKVKGKARPKATGQEQSRIIS